MGIKVGMCGTGAFADCFIPLFKHHPQVDQVVLCDLAPGLVAHESAMQAGVLMEVPESGDAVQAGG